MYRIHSYFFQTTAFFAFAIFADILRIGDPPPLYLYYQYIYIYIFTLFMLSIINYINNQNYKTWTRSIFNTIICCERILFSKFREIYILRSLWLENKPIIPILFINQSLYNFNDVWNRLFETDCLKQTVWNRLFENLFCTERI